MDTKTEIVDELCTIKLDFIKNYQMFRTVYYKMREQKQ